MAKDLLQLNKKIAVVVGGAGYLGRAIVKKLIAEDYAVIIIDKSRPIDLATHELLFFFIVDVADEPVIKGLAERIASDFGRLDFLIYAVAAPLARQPILSQTPEALAGQFAVNVFGAFNLCQAFSPLLVAGGAIIGITSQITEPGTSIASSGSYVPAKYALRGLLRVLSVELRGQAIRVCAVSPAFMPGGLNSDLPELVKEFIQTKSQLENLTSPEEVAQVVADVLSEKIKNINGQSIAVPGCVMTDL